MKKSSPTTQSLDMLLDTMCNTFGGVCFIALLIAIISSTLPKETTDADASGGITDQMLADKESERLMRRRDELRATIKLQQELLATNTAQKSVTKSEADYISSISSNAQAIAKMRREREMLEDELAKVSTASEYSKREAARLERLLKDMQESLDKPTATKKRAVRTPLERELAGLHSEDLWLRHGRLYLIDWAERSQKQVRIVDRHTPSGLTCDVMTIPGQGYRVDETFFHSEDWSNLKRRLDGKGFARIFCDEESFPQLCELRDALIYLGKMWNWHIRNEAVLHFVEGYDGRVQ